MKLRGTIRSIESLSHEGSGLTASGARPVAIASVPIEFELTDVMTVSAKPGEPVTLSASARSRDTRDLDAGGTTYSETLAALKALVPEGWRLQHIIVVDD
ncbi:hypothetical protein [Rathayibacter soli]|uniref:hypothetical protein n=1 Tax=Rathayibacter soli TaxID=3144168 RepID=UPI0027E5A20F|nr:hypothetical protein [Glaciibacter superstes]